MKDLYQLIDNHCGWLHDCIAKRWQNNTILQPHTQALKKLSLFVHDLNAAILSALQSSHYRDQLDFNQRCHEHVQDWVMQLVYAANQIGLNIAETMALIKCYRHGYLDLILQADFNLSYQQHGLLWLENFFNALDIYLCQCWSEINHTLNPHMMAVNEELVALNEELIATEEQLQQQIADLNHSQQQLSALNQRLIDIIEFLPDATFVINQKRQVIAWNKALEKMTGVTKQQILGQGNYAYALPFYGQAKPVLIDFLFEDQGQPRTYDNFKIENNVVYGEVFAPLIKNGQGAYLWLTASPLFDPQGHLTGAIQSIRDISSNKQTRETLKKYQLLSEYAQDIILFIKPSGQIIEANQAAANAYGYTRQQLLQMKIFQLRIRHPIYTKKQNQKDEQGSVCFEARHLRRDGTTFPVEVHSMWVSMGNEKIIMSIIRDITERKAAAEAIFAEKERLAITLRSIGEGVITTDTNGDITLMNRIAEKLTGFTQAEALGQHLNRIFYVLDEITRAPLQHIIQQIMRDKCIINFNSRAILVAKEGTEVNIASSGAPILDSLSRTVGVVLVFRDITHLIKMERELLKTNTIESISLLAGGIAHDFNNLLTGIMGNLSLAQLLAAGLPELSHVLREAEKATTQAKELTRQLLTFAQGGQPVKQTTSVNKLIQDSCNFALRGSNIKCQYHIPDELWPLDIDQGQISQVINNLIINAQQAMPDGGCVLINCTNVTLKGANLGLLPLFPGTYVKIEIIDQGHGIDKENQPKIFTPYFTTKEKGSGLGLAICYSIIKKHGGYIGLESKPGQGTKFYIYLPALNIKPPPEMEKTRLWRGTGRILVMDDEQMVRRVYQKILTSIGYEVELAQDGAEAVAKYQKALQKGQRYDLVIMDLTVPGGMGGQQALVKLQAIDPDILAMVSSGYSSDPVMANYKQYGFQGVITKPFNIEQISTAIYHILKQNSPGKN